ncbi:MAG: DoxX family membrane protein [Balneolaceae bacterium]
MTILIHIVRIVLGIIFLVFGLNGFYTFIPVPEFHPFMEILVTSGFIYLVKTAEVTGGLMLLSNRFVPLALGKGPTQSHAGFKPNS